MNMFCREKLDVFNQSVMMGANVLVMAEVWFVKVMVIRHGFATLVCWGTRGSRKYLRCSWI